MTSIDCNERRGRGRATIKSALDYQYEIEQLKETLALMANIQRRQAAVQRGQATWLEEQDRSMKLHNERMAHIDMRLVQMTEKEAYIDMRLAEITDKLDGLIGFAGGFFKPST